MKQSMVVPAFHVIKGDVVWHDGEWWTVKAVEIDGRWSHIGLVSEAGKTLWEQCGESDFFDRKLA